jgi:hypothetical protein
MAEETNGPAESAPDEAAGSAGTEPAIGAEGSNEEELRRQLDEELRKLRVQDVILQSVASIINLTARRIAKPDERDLEQGRVGIEAVRALTPMLPDEVQAQIRDALSELQMLYAREAGGGAPSDGSEGPTEPTPESGRPGPSQPSTSPGGRQPPPKLWTPPGTG